MTQSAGRDFVKAMELAVSWFPTLGGCHGVLVPIEAGRDYFVAVGVRRADYRDELVPTESRRSQKAIHRIIS